MTTNMTIYTKIRPRNISKGWQSLYLDTIYKGKRRTSTLGLIVKKNPSNLLEKEDKKKALETAKLIAIKKDMDLIRGERDIDEIVNENRDFIEYAFNYIEENKSILDIRSYNAAIKKLQQFLGKRKLYFSELTEPLLKRFYGFLQIHLNGITPFNYFKKLKRIIKAAVREKFLRKDPTENIKLIKGKTREKDVLELSEIKILWDTPCSNKAAKYGFLFSCLTGLRFCDIINLRWTDIRDSKIDIIQKKTKIRLIVPLCGDALQILAKMNDESSIIFDLPSHTGCLKILKTWLKKSEINKHITWHCARHSMGTNLIALGVDVAVASKILGHTSLEQTAKYVRVHEDLKEKAIEKFKPLFT